MGEWAPGRCVVSWSELEWCAGLGPAVKPPIRSMLWAMAYHANRDTGLVTSGVRLLASEAGVSPATAARLLGAIVAGGLAEMVEPAAGSRPAAYRLACPDRASVSSKARHKRETQWPVSVSAEPGCVSSEAASVSPRAKRNPNPNPSVPTGVPKGEGESGDRAPLRSAASGSAARSAAERPSGGGRPNESGDPASGDAPAPAPNPASNGAPSPLSEEARRQLYGALGKPAPARDRTSPVDWVEATRQRWATWQAANPPPPLRPPGSSPADPTPPGDPKPIEAAAEPEPPAAAPDLEPAAGDVDRPPVIPVEDPAHVSFPSDDLGAVVGPCVVCQEACPSVHNVSGQVRHATCRDPIAKPAA